MNEAKLTVLVGLPASGKSRFRAFLCENGTDIAVCPDDIRSEIFNTQFDKTVEPIVWFTAKAMTKLLLRQGRNVVIDATNTTANRRKDWIELAKECRAGVGAIFIDTNYETCRKRNIGRGKNKVVPEAAMARMRDELQPPELEEGFEWITVE